MFVKAIKAVVAATVVATSVASAAAAQEGPRSIYRACDKGEFYVVAFSVDKHGKFEKPTLSWVGKDGNSRNGGISKWECRGAVNYSFGQIINYFEHVSTSGVRSHSTSKYKRTTERAIKAAQKFYKELPKHGWKARQGYVDLNKVHTWGIQDALEELRDDFRG